MSKRRKYDRSCCCCEPKPCCCEPAPCCCEQTSCCGNGGNSGNIFGGMNSCITPIIFLLIACGSGVLNNNCSYLIILLFLLCGGCFGNLFGGESYC